MYDNTPTRVRNFYVFFFNDTATTEIYTLSLHDALPILSAGALSDSEMIHAIGNRQYRTIRIPPMIHQVFSRRDISLPLSDRKSTRLNSSHANISYAVFCLKKKIVMFFFSLTFPTTHYSV